MYKVHRKMYKVHRCISSEILNDLFSLRQVNQYNYKNRSKFIITNVKTVDHGAESISRYLEPKI